MAQTILILVLLFSLNLQNRNELKKQLGEMLAKWHHAAAVADAKTYFSYLADDAIYMGTDATEFWTKAEFQKWAKPWFKRKSAWTIYATQRNIYLSKDKTYAWFDETLVAGFGPARGSGILIKTKDGWKIQHYNLSMTIPNEVSKQVKNIVEKELNKK
jgi:ketosteroid isomerase-like protein